MHTGVVVAAFCLYLNAISLPKNSFPLNFVAIFFSYKGGQNQDELVSLERSGFFWRYLLYIMAQNCHCEPEAENVDFPQLKTSVNEWRQCIFFMTF